MSKYETIMDMSEETVLKKIGQFIREKRELKKLNQTKVAEMLGFTQSYYSLIERGERAPGIMVYISIAAVLEFDFEELMTYIALRKPRVVRPTEEGVKKQEVEEREHRMREILLEIRELFEESN